MNELSTDKAGVRAAPVVRTLGPDEWPLYRRLRLRSLFDAPEAFCSTLAEEEARTDEDWAWRLNLAATSRRDRPLVAFVAGTPAGLAWAKVDAADAKRVNLFQMWVAPEARGHGVAAALLDAAVAWAGALRAHSVRLGVVCGNEAARRLYERAGFHDIGAPRPTRPGSQRMEQTMHLALS